MIDSRECVLQCANTGTDANEVTWFPFTGQYDPAGRLAGNTTPPQRVLLPDCNVLASPRGSHGPKGGPLTIAMKRPRTEQALGSFERACLAARVASENKGQNIRVLDMRPITRLYDFFVLITGTSRRQIHTLSEEIDAALSRVGDSRLSIEGYEASKWVVQDYGDVVVHVFDPDARQYYSLEELWADAGQVEWEE